MKTCSTCKVEKEYSEFSSDTTRADKMNTRCRECHASRRRETYDKTKSKRNHLMHLYGLTQEQYNEMLISQGGGCAMCGMTPEENGQALAVDHDHSCCPGRKTCGKCVRGLLCRGHNTMLGLANDDVHLLRIAIDYLNNHKFESGEY